MSAMILWIAVGAALMYFFDPASGRDRRAWLREKVDQSSKKGAGPATTPGADAIAPDRSAEPMVGEVIEGHAAGDEPAAERGNPEK